MPINNILTVEDLGSYARQSACANLFGENALVD